ncbi:hypothetical protein TSOC111612_21895 [Tsukamurella ocularis]
MSFTREEIVTTRDTTDDAWSPTRPSRFTAVSVTPTCDSRAETAVKVLPTRVSASVLSRVVTISQHHDRSPRFGVRYTCESAPTGRNSVGYFGGRPSPVEMPRTRREIHG